MTLRAVEMHHILMQILPWMFVEKTKYYFTLLFHSFICVC